MDIHYISSIFLLILVHSICKGQSEFEEASTEVAEDGENTLRIVQGLLRTGNSTHKYCKCEGDDCECCYKVGSHKICSEMKLTCLDNNNGNEYALEGTLKINNGSIFTCSIKLKEIPKLCYHRNNFDICFDLNHKGVENKIQICGHVKEIKKPHDPEQKREEEKPDPKFDEKKYFSLYFGQFAFQ